MAFSKVGRPLLFKSAKELEEKIQAYFDSCFEEKWFDEDELPQAEDLFKENPEDTPV